MKQKSNVNIRLKFITLILLMVSFQVLTITNNGSNEISRLKVKNNL